MGVDTIGLATQLAWAGEAVPAFDLRDDPPAWNRFAHWPRGQALVLLAAVLVLLAEAAIVPITVGAGRIAEPPPLAYALGENLGAQKPPPRARDDDLALYDAAIARIARGENYYAFIVGEHRRARYPVRPAVAVRLPTLAYIDAWAGVPGQIMASIALMFAVVWAWWRRLGQEPGGARNRLMATALLFTSAALGLNRSFFVLHELWGGMLIALAFGLHRPATTGPRKSSPAGGGGPRSESLPGQPCGPPPRSKGEDYDEPDRGRWLGAWCAAALALAIREHTLPFVVLMAAYAGWRQAWREAQAWLDLAILFAIGLTIHIHAIDLQGLPGDPLGQSWFALRGLGGWLSDIVLSSNLRFLPHWAAGPLVVLMILGWAGWRSHAGAFATLLYLGYGAALMIAGRDDNYYWGAMIAPAMFIGLAFVPMAATGLLRAAAPRGWRDRAGA